jgi:Tol biopolymer transport system component
MGTFSKILAFAGTSLLTLGGCGGGGGGGGGNPPPPPPQVVRSPETLVFAAGDGVAGNGDTELYAVDDNGANRRRLSAATTASGADIQAFAVSPDGRWVAYLSDSLGGFEIDALYIVPLDGSAAPRKASRDVPSTLPRSVKSFAWSPDSAQLAYAANLDGQLPDALDANEVFVVNRDGSGEKKINGTLGLPVRVEVRNPQWSPDGRFILQEVADFSGGSGSPSAFALNLYDTTVSGANSRRLVTAKTTIKNARWSPDSSRISYMADQVTTGEYQLFVIDVTGPTNVRVTDHGDFDSEARWSPDGKRLAYLDHPTRPFPSDLVTSEGSPGARDTVLVSVSPDGRRVTDYSWSPDGGRIAYTSNEAIENVDELYVVNADGSGTPVKINGPMPATGDVLGHAWSPDGTRIAYVADQDTDGYIDLYVSASNGGRNTRVSTGLNGEEVVAFAWSADGERISFSTGPDGRAPQPDKLYASRPDGSSRLELTAPMTTGPLSFSYQGTAATR